MWVDNRGAGALTITPTTSTIDGAASLALTTNQGCLVASDGTNYYTMRGIGAGGAITTSGLTMATNKVLGRSTASTGAIEEITLGTGLLLSGGTLSSSGGVGGGGLVLLEQHTASSSATLDFTSFTSSSYDEYSIEVTGLVPATNNVSFYMRMSTDGGSTFDTSAIYDSSHNALSSNGTQSAGGGAASASEFKIQNVGQPNTSTASLSGTIKLFVPLSTALYKKITWQLQCDSNDGNSQQINGAGRYRSATAVNAIRFLYASGNIASGTIRIYGLTK
jgi:hypothetical protein